MVKSQNPKISTGGRLTKLQSINQSKFVEIGDSFTGYYYDKPEVGYAFVFFCESFVKDGETRFSAGPFQTSLVKEIIDDFTFKTKNSIYHLIDKINFRNHQIGEILNEKDTV